MQGISPFQPGRPLLSEITADKLNRILSEIKRNRPIVAAPLSARVTGDGTYISVGKMSGGGATTQHPFQLIKSTGENPEAIYARVRYGTVNGERPTGMSEGDDPPYVIELTGATGVIYLGATLDATTFEITSLWIDQAETLPEETELEVYLEIGSYSVTDGALTLAQSVTSSLAYIKAGFVNLWGQA